MKRFCCICLAALMLWSIPKAGRAGGLIPNLRETPTAAPAEAFRFRGGVQWNMSREQVRALENMELIERSEEGWSILYPINGVEVSKFTADLVYMFYNDRLKMISYDFGTRGTVNDYAYLTGALDSVYGSHWDANPADIVGVMDQIYLGHYKTEYIQLPRGWKAGEDTLIYLCYYAKDAYAILYVCAGEASGSFVTTGL